MDSFLFLSLHIKLSKNFFFQSDLCLFYLHCMENRANFPLSVCHFISISLFLYNPHLPLHAFHMFVFRKEAFLVSETLVSTFSSSSLSLHLALLGTQRSEKRRRGKESEDFFQFISLIEMENSLFSLSRCREEIFTLCLIFSRLNGKHIFTATEREIKDKTLREDFIFE
jgi:hypothetical protein